jgi:hypothetical protein
MAHPHHRTLPTGIVVGLLIATLVGLPRAARADLGDEPSKSDTSSASQIEDTDRPKESILDKKPADAAVAAKKKETVSGPPFYEKWQFWALVGGVVAGAVITVFAAQKISHQVNGGDARPCSPNFITCAGEGR